MGYIPRLKQKYRDEIVSALQKEFGKNIFEPRLGKVGDSRQESY